MRLLAVEIRRFRARRAIVVVLMVTVAAAAVLAGSEIWSSRGATAAEVSQAQQQLQSERAAVRDDYEECIADPPTRDDGLSPREACKELDPKLSWFLPREPLDLPRQLTGSGLALAILLAGAGVLAGATYAGADWHSGSLTTQLLFRPRRSPLWAAKASAVVLGVALPALVVTAGYWSALAVASEARGLGVGGDVALDVTLHAARSVVLAAAAALGAFALTMALRSTLATLVVVFAGTVAAEALWALLPVSRPAEWSLAANVQAWVLDGFRVDDPTGCASSGGGCDPTYVISAAQGAAYLGALLALTVVLSWLTFRRRDIP